MYIPKYFEVKDRSRVLKLMDDYPFATLISCEGNMPWVSHLPLLVEGGGKGLIGHLARGNPHWRKMQSNPEVTVLFHGPHTYITPTWYVSGRDVPTWNYAAVHIMGEVRLTEDFEGLVGILKKLTDKFEAQNPKPWRFELPEDLSDPTILTKAIVGFEIRIKSIEAKFKLSQNRKQEDQNRVVSGLETRTDEMSQLVRKMMLE